MQPPTVLGSVLVPWALLVGTAAFAFDSGSTGADGDFNPTVGVELQLPPNGIFNFRSVNIPAGVTVTFKRNATNTPVYMLVQGSMTLAGQIVLDGQSPALLGRGGDGNLLDDHLPGLGGPGGGSGGVGGLPLGDTPCPPRQSCPSTIGGLGQGPGGGRGGIASISGDPFFVPQMGGSGVFGGTLAIPGYGNERLVPLVGGSGGGGGSGGTGTWRGGGGGGGGGAILIAVGGTLNLTGIVRANGARGAQCCQASGSGGVGGDGSGGGIRVVATRIEGNGRLEATGFNPLEYPGTNPGRIRVEAEQYLSSGIASDPGYSRGDPSAALGSEALALRISKVGNIAVPANPNGSRDVTLPAGGSGAYPVEVRSSGVPVGSTVKLTLAPQPGAAATVEATTTGTLAEAVATATLDFPVGTSLLSASVTFAVTASVGQALSRFALGDRVERVELRAALGRHANTVLHTASGRSIVLAGDALAGALAVLAAAASN